MSVEGEPIPLSVRLRSALFQSLLGLLAVLFSLTAPLLLPLPLRWRYAVISRWARTNIVLARWICGLHLVVIGRENIPDEPVIVFSNHQSTWETLATQVLFPLQAWVMKRQLLWIPFFGWSIALLRPIAIRRSKEDRRRSLRQVIEQGTERLRAGVWVVIFPEGTRYRAGTVGPFNPGGAMLAKQSGFPVLPMAHNAGEYWPGGSLVIRPGTVRVHIGPLIRPDGLSAKEINRQAEEWIRGALGAEVGTRGVPDGS